MSNIDYDAILNDPKFGSWHGWHDEYAGLQEPAYCPAAAQNRNEFIEFCSLLKSTDCVLQIGLCRGGTHRIFELLCREVWSIDCDLRYIDKYRAAFGNSGLIFGNSHDPNVIAQAAAHAPYDVLFIDGDHAYQAVKSDWENYAPMVCSDGIVAFHDPICRPQHEVNELIDELRTAGVDICVIGTELGIAWYRA